MLKGRERLFSTIGVLREAVSRIPDTIPIASTNSSTYHHFSDTKIPDGMDFWEFVDSSYTRCFQQLPNKPSPIENVLRGPHGMDLVVSFLMELADHPDMSPEDQKLMMLKVHDLVNLVHEQ